MAKASTKLASLLSYNDVISGDDFGFTLYMDQDGNIVCGMPPVVAAPVDEPAPAPTPVGVILDDGGFTVYIDAEGNAVCGQPPVVAAPVDLPVPTGEQQLIDDGGFIVYIDAEGNVVCGTPPVVAAPVDEVTPVGMILNDGGFTVYIDENGNAVCGQPPAQGPVIPFNDVLADEDHLYGAFEEYIPAQGTEKVPAAPVREAVQPVAFEHDATPVLDLQQHAVL